MSDASPPVDLSNLRLCCDGDAETESLLIQMFFTDAAAQMRILSASTDDNLGKVWSEAAHALKGLAGNIGAETLQALCATAQHSGNAVHAEKTAQLHEIQSAYAAVLDHLEILGHKAA